MMLRFSTFLLPHLMDMGATQYYLSYDVTFGYLRIIGYVHLPGAYRSLSRPSSILEQSYPPNNVKFEHSILSMYGIIIVNLLDHN